MLSLSPKITAVKEKASSRTVVIGSGTEATVYLGKAQYKQNKGGSKVQLIALKTPSSSSFLDNLKKEAQILSKFDHPNIVKAISCTDKTCSETLFREAELGFTLPLEISTDGSLFDLIFNSKAPIPPTIAKTYFLQLMEGIEALHSRGVIHRDLKLENFLLFESGATVKISDFGLSEVVLTDTFCSKDLQKSYSSTKLAGSLPYMSPECHIGRFSVSTDLFSLAVAGFIMVFGIPPFASAKSTDKHYRYISSGNMKEYVKILLKSTKLTADQIDYDFLELFFAMTHPSAEQRPTLCEIKKSPWLKDAKLDDTEQACQYLAKQRPNRGTEFSNHLDCEET